MSSNTGLLALQSAMKDIGLYSGKPDGLWGPISQKAFLEARTIYKSGKQELPALLSKYAASIAWSTKVSPAFIAKVKGIAEQLAIDPDDLMSCMAFETGATFSPSIKNAAGAPYYGLIQFGASAAKDVGTTLDNLVKMNAIQQLDYVLAFFRPYRGKLKTLSDIYMRILYPVAVGKAEDFVLFNKANEKSKAYIQNKGLDINKDGLITKAEATAKVAQKKVEGLHPNNLRV